MHVLFPRPDKVVCNIARVKIKAIEFVQVEQLFIVNVLNYFTIKHGLAIVPDTFLVGCHSLNKPAVNFASPATVCVFREPSVGLILYVYLCVHNLSPFLQSLDHVVRFLIRKLHIAH